MSSHRYLTYSDRLKIETLYNRHTSKKEIAVEIGCCLKTIYNEIKRGLYDHLDGKTWLYVKRYSADIAQKDADWKQTAKGRPLALGHNYAFAEIVREYITVRHFAPDVIVHILQASGSFTVSTNTLYRYIDKGYIPGVTNKNLLEKRHKRPYRHIKTAKRAPKGKSIEKRPPAVEQRSNIGHWEGDSIIGKQKGKGESILTFTERLSRLVLIRNAAEKSSAATVKALQSLDGKYTFKTLTLDNGSEFQDCSGMEYRKDGSKRTDVYYCHPYTSCERGTNERMNRMVRRFLPKGKSLKRVSQRRLTEIENWLNNYPRRSLCYRTPLEVYQAYLKVEL